MSLPQKFAAHWKAKSIDKLKAPHLLALSGGIDSMVLAHLLIDAGVLFAVAHCNFKLRAADADGDEAFVKTFAESHNLACFITSFDTATISAEQKKGIQEVARALRYDWLKEIQALHGFGTIITAHHADDNAETLLINLLRGTGIRGLHGIRDYHNHLLRPMLFATKEEVLAYAAENKIAHREDESNATDKYLRNAIRHKVLPAFKEIMPDAIQRLNDNINRFAEGEQLYQKAIDAEVKKLLEKRGNDYYIPIRKLIQRQPLQTICFELLRPFGFLPAQTPDILNLLHADTGQYLISPTHRLIRNRNFLVITAAKTEEADLISIDSFPTIIKTPTHQYSFSSQPSLSTIDKSASIALLDAKDIVFPLILRRWRIGDYFYPLGMGMKKKKLSRFFIGQKLALHEKEQVWILESGKRIAWVSGMRLDERFKITEKTTAVIRVEMKPL